MLGIELDSSAASSGLRVFTPEEEEEFQQLAKSDGLYERFANSVAPSIYGNLGKQIIRCVIRRHCTDRLFSYQTSKKP